MSTIKVESNLNKSDPNIFEKRAHYVPCKIEEDGPANVKQYFEPYVVQSDDGELKASFRGRPLDGVSMKLPDGCHALLATELHRPLSEDADRKLQVVGGFKEFVYWNWDKKPSKNDTFCKAMDWIDIADVIHGD